MKYVVGLGMVALLGGVVFAQDVQVQAGRNGVDVDVNREATTEAPRTLEKNAHAMRVSELIGLNVRNNANDELGEIEDVVVDLNTGKIRYAAVSMGGFLGIGDKLFAVPFDAISFRTHHDDGALVDSTERVAVVNVTKESLENAQGFDQDHWPNMADRTWQQTNDRPYRTGKRLQRARPGIDR